MKVNLTDRKIKSLKAQDKKYKTFKEKPNIERHSKQDPKDYTLREILSIESNIIQEPIT